MTLVRAAWTETKHYEADLEIDGFDPSSSPKQQIREAIADLASEHIEDAEMGSDEPVDVDSFKVVREGEEPIEIKVSAPTHEPDFDL